MLIHNVYVVFSQARHKMDKEINNRKCEVLLDGRSVPSLVSKKKCFLPVLLDCMTSKCSVSASVLKKQSGWTSRLEMWFAWKKTTLFQYDNFFFLLWIKLSIWFLSRSGANLFSLHWTSCHWCLWFLWVGLNQLISYQYITIKREKNWLGWV